MANGRESMRKRISRRAAVVGPVKFLLGCFVIIFVLSIFLQVRKVEVTGAEHYTDNEIVQAAGVDVGDNLFFINRFAAVSGILAKLPYVESVSVVTQLPGTVILDVTESQALAWVELEGQRWIIDRNCKVLEQGTTTATAQLTKVSGVTPVNPRVGETLEIQETNGAVETLAEMLDQIQRRSLAGEVSSIDITDPAAPVMDYLGRFTVQFGNSETMDYQFGKLVSAVSQLTTADRGSLDISGAGEEVVFTPF